MTKRFDLFLSHHSVDEPWVLRLKNALEERGLTVWLDRDEIRPGDLFVGALEQGLLESRAVALVASSESLRSGWVREEYSRALVLSHDGGDAVQLIPVLLRDVELPGFLANRNWVDFRDASSFNQSLDKLIWGVTGKKPKASPAKPLKRRRARQSSLSELLVSVADKRDAWRRFVAPVEFVGRDGALKRLANFASAEEPFLWQVLYGPHAVGKSRLALEWLRRLGSLDHRWTTGFFPDRPEDIERLLALSPLGPTAIVIDSAGGLGPKLWTDLDTALQRWRKLSHKVRFLLLAHSEMSPSSADFERDERLREVRESAARSGPGAVVRSVERGDGEATGEVTAEPITAPGIKLHPLEEEADQRRIIELAAASARVNVSESDVRRALEEARGRPAFLALAGRYPKDWHHRLQDYAHNVVEKARNMFDADDGLRVLVLSALAGGEPEAVRQRIAPKAQPAEKVAELFSVDVTLTRRGVPAFEPDLLGQELAFSALAKLTQSDPASLCGEIASLAPNRFLEKTIGMWQRHAEPAALQALVGGLPRTDAAQRAATLEVLFDSAAKVSPRGINLPFGTLSQIRGAHFVEALLHDAPIQEPGNARLVAAALREAPDDSVAQYLLDVHGEIPCTSATRSGWAALLHHYLAPSSAVPPPAILAIRIQKGPVPESTAQSLLEKLQSPERFERAFAAFRVGEALRDRGEPPRALLPHYDDILDALAAMVERPNAADRLPGAFAIAWMVREPTGGAGHVHIRPRDVAALLNSLKDRRSSHNVIAIVADTLGLAFRSPFSEFEFMQWLPEKRRPAIEEPRATQPEARSEAVRLMHAILEQGGLGRAAREALARACLRLDLVSPQICSELAELVTSAVVSLQKRIEMIGRLARLDRDSAVAVLSASFESGRSDDQVIAVATLMRLNAADAIEAIDARAIGWSETIDLHALAEETRQHAGSGTASGPASTMLRERAQAIYVKSRGHLIHKLKAKDSTDRWAYYFVLVEPEKEGAFLASLKGDGVTHLEDYGRVIASNYGEEPSEEIKRYLKERYDFDV